MYSGIGIYFKDVQEREEREKFFSEALDEDKIQSMDEFEFGEIISKL
ncbi:MAG: hypothetical protein ACTSP1_12305 [Candidatus Freyarchaeota archaeon]